MKITTSFSRRALVLRALATSLLIGLIFGTVSAQQPQVPEAERQAAQKIMAATDLAAQLQAAGDFIKQFPKSTLRQQVAQGVAKKISEQTDQAQKLKLAENFSTIFTEANEKDMMTAILLDGYLKANQLDDAFRVAPAWLEKNPEDVGTLTQMALLGVDQVKRNNNKFAVQSGQYAGQAIALIEADKKPANLNAEQWAEYKTRWLPALYQSTGLISLMTGNNADAKTKLEKAISLNPTDPFNYLLLSSLVNDEYQALAKQHKEMTDGAPKEAKLKEALAKMQQLIDIYAQVVARSESDPQYKALHDQVKPELESYYKFLNNGSTKGLQELINKHKK